MQAWLNRRWYGPQPGACRTLRPLEWLYGAGVALRRARAPAPSALPAPVIIVGNLTVGGTGKTPLTVWLARQLRQRGLEVGLISRGYGRRDGGVRLLEAQADWREVGDEPLILARASGCPTAVGRDRVAAARAVLARGARVIVSDDGLQHLALPRACSIVVADGARGFGNGRLLPGGPLREPLSRLAQADALVINGAAEHPSLGASAAVFPPRVVRMDLQAGPAVALGSLERRALEAFRGGPVHAVAGIGHPQRFFRDLRAHGLELIEHPFPDHHPLRAQDLDFGDDRPVLMTEKDAVKCALPFDRRLWWVPVEVVLSGADAARLIELSLRTIDSFARPPGG
jgi:tetraacyldisaccharide 4'-kinase